MQPASKSIRLFIGTSASQQLLSEFSSNIAFMKTCPWARAVRWVESDNIHMTLKFLGSLNTQSLDVLQNALHERLQFDAVRYRVDQIQLFPTAVRPKVIAAQIENNDKLNELVRNLEQLTNQFGVPNSGIQFRGHFSLARCSPEFPRNLSFEALPVQTTEALTKITLYRSDTQPSGAVYTPLETFHCRACS